MGSTECTGSSESGHTRPEQCSTEGAPDGVPADASASPPTRRPAARPAFLAYAARQLVYALADLPVALAGFVFAVVGLAIGASLTPVFIGLPLIVSVLAGARGWGAGEIGRARRPLRVDFGRPAAPPRGPGFWAWLKAGFTDSAAWRAIAYFLLKPPLAALACAAALSCYGIGLTLLTYPLWFQTGNPGGRQDGVVRSETVIELGSVYLDSWPTALAAAALGAVLILCGPWVVRAAVVPDRLLVRALLRPTANGERIRALQQARAYAVDDAAAARRRIERDLHDGAQARLVTLAMDLGLAKETLGEIEHNAEIEQARELIGIAHENAKKALTELRNLARGIHPPILDNGLGAALSSLTEATSIPVSVHVDLPFRPSPAVEAIVYFCAAELLTNITKHAQATHASVRATQRFDMLRIEVEDDGCGGARFTTGSGLPGLSERLTAIDGRISLNSPPGGPTIVTVHLPLRA